MYRNKLTKEQAAAIKSRYLAGESVAAVAAEFDISISLVHSIGKGLSWSWIDKEKTDISSLPDEIWKAIEGFPNYQVSNLGRIKSCAVGTRNPSGSWILLHGLTGTYGEQYVNLVGTEGKQRFSVHSVVLTTFVGVCPTDCMCRHLNGDPQDNRLDNLVWGTPKENQKDRIEHETSNRGSQNGKSFFTEEQVLEIYKRLQSGESQKKIAEEFLVDASSISNIKRGRNWGWLTGKTFSRR